jgi:hypothetical protein
LVDSIARSKDKTRDIDICFKIISNHILPLELVVVDIEKQFSTMLYYLCKATINKIENKTKDTIGLAISKESNLFTKLVTYYSLMRGKFFLSSILIAKLEAVITEVQTSKGPDQTTMINFAISILVLILDNIKKLPIGFKCISSAIYNELNSSYDIAFIQAQILNLLCIKLISPFIVNYFKDNHFNLLQVVYFMQKIATNNNDFTVPIDSSVSASLALFHEYANKQLSEKNLECDVTVTNMLLFDTYPYNLEQSALTFEDFKKFKYLIEHTRSSYPYIL